MPPKQQQQSAKTFAERQRYKSTIITDPPKKRNGRCVVCNGSRPPIAVRDGDPFCSANCARTWHQKHNPKYPKMD